MTYYLPLTHLVSNVLLLEWQTSNYRLLIILLTAMDPLLEQLQTNSFGYQMEVLRYYHLSILAQLLTHMDLAYRVLAYYLGS